MVYFPFGGADARGLPASVKLSDGLRTIMWFQEDRRACCRDASLKVTQPRVLLCPLLLEWTGQVGRPINQVIYILDLEGLGLKHLYKPGMEMFQQVWTSS